LNDSFGRYTGDLFLQCVADRLKQHFESSEQLAHLGGGAFAVIFPETDRTDAPAPHLQIFESFMSPLTVRGRDMPVPLKCGLARFPAHGSTAEMLVQNAEAALHAAQSGGESHYYYRPEMSSGTAERLALEYRLRGALERGEFVLHFQPQFHRRNHRIVGCEALLRWQDPERGLIPPGSFLPMLESTGLIVAVGDWVVSQVAAAARRWRLLDLPPVRIAVNVSTLELSRPAFAEHFLEILQSYEAGEESIDVEITEGELFNDFASVTHALQQLRSRGVRVAIDDFGMGYSSLSRLAELPIDILKIDRAFTARLTPERSSQAIVSTIIALARTYDLNTVAEGVETPEQLEILTALGCEQSQGYLHSPALPAEVFEGLLRAARTSTRRAADECHG
jgi:EAL domain-containing protein (putative c-di-GMP-specific phosphodiesterase class I)